MGEDTCYAGALGGSIGMCLVGGGCCGLTVDGPAPMRIARPVGAMVRLSWSCFKDLKSSMCKGISFV